MSRINRHPVCCLGHTTVFVGIQVPDEKASGEIGHYKKAHFICILDRFSAIRPTLGNI